ncbi:hypothetical protein MKEN_00323300 [Mycena kentingensis (nom. inval.)]|nr:hypothetical protein MKEN_00323300 [Mycena kentingensis (nom. inval.)]
MSAEILRFTPQQIPGVGIVNAFAVLSTLALLAVAGRVVWLALRRFFSGSSDSQSKEYVFFNTVLGNYAACLLLANIVTGVAGLMGLSQMASGGIEEGLFCTVQAIIMQTGNFANAWFTMAIAIHTIISLVLARRQSVLVCVVTVFMGWGVSGLLAAAPLLMKHERGPVYGISGLSCGIRNVYTKEMFFFHLLPILATSILSALLYSLIFLVLRGTLVVRGGLKLTLDPNERWAGNVTNYHKFISRIARSLLWFPIAYILFLVPYSVTRLIDLSGRVCPFPLLVVAYVFWFLLGIANVLTLYNTFRVLGPAFDARSTSQRDLESNGTDISKTHSPNMAPMIATIDQYSYRGDSISEKSSRPASMSSFNKVVPAPSENNAASFRLQAPPLAARIQDRRHEYSESLHTRTDSQRTWTSAPSFYEYNGPSEEPTRLSALLLNQPPIDAVPQRVRSSRLLPPQQQSPMLSLPAPPRPVKRQVTARRPVIAQPNSPQDSIEVRYSNGLEWTGESDERPEGYMPRGLVSAVGNSHNVPAVPKTDDLPIRGGSLPNSDDFLVRGGSMDMHRSRSSHASNSRLSDPRSTRLSTPEPQPPKF